MSSDEVVLRLSLFEAALGRLRNALAQPKSEWTRDAAIQRFEFTFELAWKVIGRLALREGLDCASPRQAFRTALRLGWIADDAAWLSMLDDRNRTSHTYDETTAEGIYAHLPTHLGLFEDLLARLREASGAGPT